jgi:hypothetical protein
MTTGVVSEETGNLSVDEEDALGCEGRVASPRVFY